MPTYQFRCPECATLFEEKRTFARSDDPALCPSCGGSRSSKVFGTAMFYSPRSAAKSLLEPKSCPAPSAAAHASGCPCCAGKPV